MHPVLQHILYGLAVSYLFSLPVGMINLSTLSVTLTQGTRRGMLFATGASIVEVIQAFIAILLLEALLLIPALDVYLKLASIPVFFVLAVIHWRKDPAVVLAESTEVVHTARQNSKVFGQGLLVSAFNMLAYPFWLLWGKWFSDQGILVKETSYIAVLAGAIGIGTFLSLLTYVLLSRVLVKRLSVVNRYANKAIALLFGVLAVGVLLDVIRYALR